MSTILKVIGRNHELFTSDMQRLEQTLSAEVSQNRFLVLGAAGSIGQAVTKEIFARNPKKLHAVDISENNLVELVRDIRSSFGYMSGEFKTFALDIGSWQYDSFIEQDGAFDYVLNLSALKHVRSEKDPFTLMRMIEVNVFNTDKTVLQSIAKGTKKYFCVSTDKAANPVNMMGGSKRIMELFLARRSKALDISTARFANVAFSDGSLLHGFNERLAKKQPIVAPNDVKRYFITPKESGELCLLSCLLGENGDVFFPKLSESLHLITFSEIAKRFLATKGLKPIECANEEEAREASKNIDLDSGFWPCLFTKSNTTGEKNFEEFYTELETLDMDRFDNLGVIKSNLSYQEETLDLFEDSIQRMRETGVWKKRELVALFEKLIPNFSHLEKGKYLDSKM